MAVALGGATMVMTGQCGAAANWQTDMEQAMSAAQKEGGAILVEFTGSDWCPPCRHLRAQVFPSDEFADYVSENKLQLVELDFPKDQQKLSDAQKAHNEKWRVHFGVNSFPTVVVADGKGAPYGVVNGATPTAPEYLNRLSVELKRKADVEAALAAAAELQGLERAQAEDAAIKYLPLQWRMLHKDVVQDIIENDPDDTLGYERQRTATEQSLQQMQELARMFDAYSGKVKPEEQDEALKLAHELLQQDKWLPLPRFYINKFLSDSYAIKRDVDNALKYMKAAVESAPESDEAHRLLPWVQNFEKHLPEIKKQHAEAAAKRAAEQQPSAN